MKPKPEAPKPLSPLQELVRQMREYARGGGFRLVARSGRKTADSDTHVELALAQGDGEFARIPDVEIDEKTGKDTNTSASPWRDLLDDARGRGAQLDIAADRVSVTVSAGPRTAAPLRQRAAREVDA